MESACARLRLAGECSGGVGSGGHTGQHDGALLCIARPRSQPAEVTERPHAPCRAISSPKWLRKSSSR